MSKEGFDILSKKNGKLVEISKFFLNHYHNLISLTSFVVSFFDPQGYLIEIRIAEKFQELARQWYSEWAPGALWNEEAVGTTAIGLVIRTKKPACVFGPQHYLKRSHGATGYGAPIFDPDGTFLGGIILLCRYDRANNHAYGMTIAAAHLIENQLKINRSLDEARAAFARSEIAYSYQQTVMASIPEALIAIDNEGVITLINDQARKLPAFAGENVVGRVLKHFLGQKNRQILSLIDKNDHLVHVEVRISSGKTSSDYTLTCNPILSQSGGVIGKVLILTGDPARKETGGRHHRGQGQFHIRFHLRQEPEISRYRRAGKTRITEPLKCPAPGSKRCWKGRLCPGYPQRQRAQKRSLSRHKLLRHPQRPYGERAFRPRGGRLYRVAAGRLPGKVRTGRRRNDFSRRNWRDAP